MLNPLNRLNFQKTDFRKIYNVCKTSIFKMAFFAKDANIVEKLEVLFICYQLYFSTAKTLLTAPAFDTNMGTIGLRTRGVREKLYLKWGFQNFA